MNSESSLRNEALRLAQHAKARGLTQSSIAEHLQASQSQVSRILAGTSKRRSKLFDAVCKYVFSDSPEQCAGTQIASAEALHQALDSVWDGTSEHAQALAGVIRSLGALTPKRGPGDVA